MDNYSSETLHIIEDVRAKIEILRQRGVRVEDLFFSVPFVHQLKITREHKIVLVGCEVEQEIKMTPIMKAVYLLFLRHEEGIEFKRLGDYREELMSIYLQFKNSTQVPQKVVRSIEDITNPLSNSINEKCARIKQAFLSILDPRTAQFFIIAGERGEKKFIALDRKKVIWE